MFKHFGESRRTVVALLTTGFGRKQAANRLQYEGNRALDDKTKAMSVFAIMCEKHKTHKALDSPHKGQQCGVRTSLVGLVMVPWYA